MKTPGVIWDFVFRTSRPCPVAVLFTSIVPQAEGFENPQYVKTEERFSKKVKSSHTYDCIMVVSPETFLVTAFLDAQVGSNWAVESVCPGLDWKGEITVVQVGRFVTFFKQVKNTSVMNRAVSSWVIRFVALKPELTSFRFISEYKYCVAVGDPLPTNLKVTLWDWCSPCFISSLIHLLQWKSWQYSIS